ncbi:energy transducer TonB [Pseudomonas cavernae]|uniref:Energy transducer TonB n=1 Tax=Pseudomonas cavernae TaxID=2320867 RepID=A0A385Z291_9PSED|nr:energy transducer TonB [Pseudomonas cavernae]AYC31682.1 energy transducer TonB [Pseudomonas cavernae]
MPRMPFYLSLSLALHAGLGWLLQGQWLAHGQPYAPSRPAVIQISLAPLAAPPPLAPVQPQVATTPPSPTQPSSARPTPVKPPAKPAVAKAPAPAPRPRALVRAENRAPAAAARPASAALAAASPSVAAPRPAAPVVEEVLSREPSFRQPPQQPSYPAQARRRNQQGVVLVEVRLDARGEQRELRLLRSSGVDSLDRAALTAVAGWRFHPQSQNGQAVPSRVQIPIQFALTASR